jgi:hypothetical protein
VSRAFPSCTRSILTEIDLCHACSGTEIEEWKRLDRAWCLLRALSPAEWPSVLAEGLAGRRQEAGTPFHSDGAAVTVPPAPHERGGRISAASPENSPRARSLCLMLVAVVHSHSGSVQVLCFWVAWALLAQVRLVIESRWLQFASECQRL